MGASISASSLGRSEELLDQLSGPQHIPQQDVFWKQLFMFGEQLSSLDPSALEQVLRPYIADLVAHSGASHNFFSLIVHTLGLANDAGTGKNRRAAANALCLVRCIIKQVIEGDAVPVLHALFDVPPAIVIAEHLLTQAGGPHQLMRAFVQRLLTLVTETEVSDATYALVYEAVHTLLVCASTQLYGAPPDGGPHGAPPPPGAHPLLELLMQQAALTPTVVQRLLQLVVSRPPPPRGIIWAPPPPAAASRTTSAAAASIASSAARGAVSAAAALLWLPVRTLQAGAAAAAAVAGGTRAGSPAAPSAADAAAAAAAATTGSGGPLCEAGVLLLLVLVHQPDEPHAWGLNPFRQAVYLLRDLEQGGDAEGGQAAGVSSRYAHVSFGQLHAALTGPGAGLGDEQRCLLLYSFLHGCKGFQDYLSRRPDPEALVVPLLRMLHQCPRSAHHHMYMLQVLVLILSQDPAFSKAVHKVVVPTVPWYTEQRLSAVPLGSLVFIVLLRTVSSSCGRRADLFLPTNALAAAANMAPYVDRFGSVAAQKLVGLLQVLSRRYTRLCNAMTSAAPGPAPIAVLLGGPGPSLSACGLRDDLLLAPAGAGGTAEVEPAVGGTPEDIAELSVLEEFLRIVLEVINAVLLPAVQRNPELLYALLHRQEVLAALKGHPRLGEHVRNLQLVVDFFNQRLDDAKAAAPNADWSVRRVLELVTASAPYWRPDGIVAFAEQRFGYEEEPNSAEFFVPYVWRLVTAGTRVPWRLDIANILPTPAAPPPLQGSDLAPAATPARPAVQASHPQHAAGGNGSAPGEP